MSRHDDDGLRTLLVGLDGACLPVVDPLIDDGRLPVLADLLERGASGPLESQIPPWTPSAWPSLYTGTNPGSHGAFDFLTFDGYDWDVVNRSHVREHAIWELLSEHDRTSVVVNVPVTAPPPAFDGALVPGYVGPESPPTHPEGLIEDLREELGEYRVYAPRGVEGDEQIEWYRRLTRMRGAAFRHLADRFDPEFGFLQFQQTDTVFHERPEDDEAVNAVYETVDEELGAVLDACDPETVFVVSDHGIGPYRDEEFRVNEFLRERGFVATTRGEGGMPSWGALGPENLGEDGGEGDDDRSLAERAVATAAAHGLTSQRIEAILSRLGLADLALKLVSTDTVRAGTERVDFERSTAYMRSRTELGIRINLAGREPNGTVSPAEYPSVRDDVVDELASARTPDGDPVFSEVGPREEFFEGEYIDDAADIIAVPDEFDTFLTASLRGDLFGPTSETWNHKRDGLVAAVGAGVDADGSVEGAHLFDVAPTVLSALGVPPSDRMDGGPLPVVDPVPPDEYPPYVATGTRRTDDDDVEQRLADLGYLDDS
ncbi:alkaline phosphatase family protein (plasmid) [Halorarum halophilum]|uniref:Alkaline phosphatase family protein n=1 Tax=Halorarum halophilum TaxID=2743090 RepID=A0A7D5GK85_9EURY|nr:alkaline phosphatase family protein [Halobaculum halophilum]QLG29591.1 alkaline phosphatase family protein [Halobaculum halophilum]